MPALAVTEHGNLFSAIVFHDKARQRGIKPILGCEVYVAPGSRLTKGGPIGETANHLILLAETNEGFHNLVKLTSSAYTEGFYYKPRIDKDLLARHSKGLIGLSSCLKGEMPSELRADQAERGREGGGDVPGHPRRGQLLPRAAVPGHRGAADRQQRPAAPVARSRHPAGLHQRRALPAARRLPPARHPALHRHRQDGERRRAHAVLRRPVLPEDARGDGGGLRPPAGGHAQHGGDRRPLQRRPVGHGALPAELPGARRVHARQATSSTSCARASRCAWRGCRRCSAAGSLRHSIDEYRDAPPVRDRRHQADAVPGLLPDRLGLHPLRARAGHPGRARAAARRPAAWWPTACASPTSTRCSSTCCSSAS